TSLHSAGSFRHARITWSRLRTSRRSRSSHLRSYRPYSIRPGMLPRVERSVKATEQCLMRAIWIPAGFLVAVLAAGLSSTPATAKGCIKGAIAGGVAGHYAGHHGLLGAGAGCVIGHHMANKQARERVQPPAIRKRKSSPLTFTRSTSMQTEGLSS